MRTSSYVLAASSLAALLLLSPFAASAADALPIADLPAQRVETDVRAACPGIDAALQRSLATTFRHSPRGGAMKVTFELTGNDVANVHVATEPWSWGYGRDIRKAVRTLDCVSRSGHPQTLAFLLQVTDGATPPDQPQFAVLP